MRRLLARLGLIVAGLFAGLLCLAVAECSLRLGGLGEGPPGYDPLEGFSAAVPLFERATRRDGTPVFRVSPARLRTSDPSGVAAPEREFLAAKPPGGFRAFVVGGSSAAGFPYPPAYAYSAWLARRLAARLPDVPCEVVNAAVPGYGSRRVLLVVREIAAFEPDLVIVDSGHNEWAEHRYYSRLLDLDPRLFAWRERLVTTRLFTLLSRLRPGPEDPERALESFLADEREEQVEMFAVFSRRVRGADYATPQDVEQRDLRYRLHMEETVRAARSAGARVALLTLTQNFADWAPGASTHASGVSPAALSRFEELVAAGDRARSRGECAAALEAYTHALGIDEEFAALHYSIALCHRALGHRDLARRHFRRASDLDRVPHGAPTQYNDLIRELTARSGLFLVDADAALTDESDDGLVGNDLFVEFAHPNLRGHQRIARELERTLRAAGIPRPPDRWREAPLDDPTPESLYAAHPELRVREHQAIRFACTVARRDACVSEQTRVLQELGSGSRASRR